MSFLEYAPAPESTSILNLSPSYGLFINGEWVDGGDDSYTTISPATEKPIAEIAHASANDVDRAVAAARRAYDTVWSRMSGADRGKYLFRIARLIQERARELAVAETLDNGKPIRETRDVDVPLVAAWFFHYAGWADKLEWVSVQTRNRSGLPVRLFRGTFRCSCSRGRSPPHWRPETPSSSSRPKQPR